MNKFRYVWPEHTMVQKSKGWPSFKIKNGETIETELDIKYMKSNRFVLLGEEVDEIVHEFEALRCSEDSLVLKEKQSLENFLDSLNEQKEAAEEKFEKFANLRKSILDEKSAELKLRLEELSKDDDKDIAKAAREALNKVFSEVTATTKNPEGSEDKDEERLQLEAKAKELGINVMKNWSDEAIKNNIAKREDKKAMEVFKAMVDNRTPEQLNNFMKSLDEAVSLLKEELKEEGKEYIQEKHSELKTDEENKGEDK